MYFLAKEEISFIKVNGDGNWLKNAVVQPVDIDISFNPSNPHHKLIVTHEVVSDGENGERKIDAELTATTVAYNGGEFPVFYADITVTLPLATVDESGNITVSATETATFTSVGAVDNQGDPVEYTTQKRLGMAFDDAEMRKMDQFRILPNVYIQALDQGLLDATQATNYSLMYTGLLDPGITPFDERDDFIDLNSTPPRLVVPQDQVVFPETGTTFGEATMLRFTIAFNGQVDMSKFDLVDSDTFFIRSGG